MGKEKPNGGSLLTGLAHLQSRSVYYGESETDLCNYMATDVQCSRLKLVGRFAHKTVTSTVEKENPD